MTFKDKGDHVSMKSADYFCSNPAHRQNDRTNDRQTALIT